MNCLICGKDTGLHGMDYAIQITTDGNYGSQVLDQEKITFSICDACLVARRDRIMQRVRAEGSVCMCPNPEYKFVPVDEETIPRAL